MVNNNPIQKFQNLLKELFQFEASDLDFGIYRILNFKRDQIAKFIDEKLKEKVESAFAKHKGERVSNINQAFEEAKLKITQAFGQGAFSPTGELKEEFKETPYGVDFLAIKAKKEDIEVIEDIKLQVFNDLYNFFSRYYEEGDFIPQYRYSIKTHKYAIPYNGEEVKLYWSNNEQYYTKTGILFRDYTFKCDSLKVAFRTAVAEEELGSNKATKERFFILDDEIPIEKLDDKAMIISFQYRELTEEEVKSYGVEGGSNTSKQEKINLKTNEKILRKIDNATLKGLLSKEYKAEKPLLLYQIARFTAKNTKDYFIHKNLKKFLSEQLDYFIKAEVISIDTLEKEKYLDKHITRANVVRELGESIIDFLAQIEDFQKKLWEKKKFVLKTEYVISTDQVPEEFYPEIWENKEQKKEWKVLGFELPQSKDQLKNTKLPIDTKYFSQEFKNKFLEKITEKDSLDDLLDGVLIKSENYQALNLLLEKYKFKINAVYIDPPYNTGSDDFLYRDRYRHSSWLTMMENRLSLAKELMKNKGVIFISIDDNEKTNLEKLILHYTEKGNLIGPIIVQVNKGGRDYLPIAKQHEYVICFTFDKSVELLHERDISDFKYNDLKGKFEPRDLRNRNPKFTRKNRPNLYYPFFINPSNKDKYGFCAVSLGKTKHHLIELLPKNKQGKDSCWRWGQEEVMKNLNINNPEDSEIVASQTAKGKWNIHEKYRGTPEKARSIWDDSRFRTENGTIILRQLFGKHVYDFPKPVDLIEELFIYSTESRGSDIVVDFFAGSGTSAHAVMKLNKEDKGKRKFILVDMAKYFETVIIPRIKKVTYSFNWEDGKPQDTIGINTFFKYQIIEQYEDALDNIELIPKQQAKLAFSDNYLLKYFLDFEARENATFLNIDKLKNPFAYKLKVNLEEVGEPQEIIVDIPETFNYLLGLHIKRIKMRKNNGIKYQFVLGEKGGKDIAIVWRNYEDNWVEKDFKRDKELIINELESWEPSIVYINGQSILTQKLGKLDIEIHYIESEFKNLMGG